MPSSCSVPTWHPETEIFDATTFIVAYQRQQRRNVAYFSSPPYLYSDISEWKFIIISACKVFSFSLMKNSAFWWNCGDGTSALGRLLCWVQSRRRLYILIAELWWDGAVRNHRLCKYRKECVNNEALYMYSHAGLWRRAEGLCWGQGGLYGLYRKPFHTEEETGTLALIQHDVK